MKNLSLLLTLVCLTLQTGFSQTNSTNVKRQYHDASNASTTVVVKEKNASDMDVLNSQFNINDVSMGEVIFIKTEDLAPSKPKSERTSFEDMGKEPVAGQEVTSVQESESTVDQEVTTVQESTKPARTVAAQPVEQKSTAKAGTSSRAKAARPQMRKKVNKTTKATTTKTVAKPQEKRAQKYFGVGTSRKYKMKKKKLKKRKRVRRSSRNKCFSF